MIPLTGFAPDVDSTTPGVITACTNMLPTLRGMAAAPTPQDVGASALPGECRGGAVLTRLDKLNRVFAGTRTGLYELSSMAFVPVSRSGGYTGNVENRWRFAQFGNASLACNETEQVQVSTAIGTSFADIPQSPKARMIETASGFVLAFGLNATYVGGDRPDAWACSHIYDHLTWTPAPTNQAAFGYLLDTPGDIRAAKRLGKDVAVYKERSLYLGRYIGPPVIWQWDLIASNVGAISAEAVIDTGTAHLFIGRDDFWLFDGSRPQPIGAPVKEWFFANSDATYRYRIRSHFDQAKNLCWWFYPTNGSGGALTDALVYNLNNERWGRVTLPVEAVFSYQGADVNYDNWPADPTLTFDTMPDLPFDSPAFDTSSAAMGVVGVDHKIKTVTGPAGASSFTTGDFGDDEQYTTLARVTPRFTARPSASSVTHYTRNFSGGQLENRGSSALAGSHYDTLASGRYHRLRVDLAGDFEIVGFTPALTPDGME
jgi:hypothetical protein